MKQRHFSFSVLAAIIVSNILIAQMEKQDSDGFPPNWKTSSRVVPTVQPIQESWTPTVTKRSGHYTKADWKNLIDSLWGPGISTAEKLAIFDDYWNLVDQTWGGFPNLAINWDSLKNVYRPEVAAGVSRGRFYGILSRLSRALNELHTVVIDIGVDKSLGVDWSSSTEYPNYPSYTYQRGIPIFNTSASSFRSNFGAGITPLDDSTALVYSVIPNHPLNLQPGDIILGYDGIPWKYLIKELFDAELPIFCGGGLIGSSPHSAFHIAMISVGMNWGLFDTIDVFKYTTKDTVHFPTSLLQAIAKPYHIATEQLPVNGVPFPNLAANKMVSWGVIEGTTIGYIYVWDWWGNPIGQTRVLFGQAVNELLHQKNVSGLILDFRTNFGGLPEYANDGFQQLFNFDPTVYYSWAQRVVGNDHYAFNLLAPPAAQFFTLSNIIFDRPIAVLAGPNCLSSGDYNAFRMRFHPMARSFGKRTSGAYVAWSNKRDRSWNQTYYSSIYDGSVYSNYNNEGYMIHKSFPVDEEVWLTQAGVAKGEDDVVKRALEWINTVAYAHSPKANKTELNPNGDSVTITAVVNNPLSHTIGVSFLLTDLNGTVIDSVLFFNDGLHNDGTAGDSVWGTILKTPARQGTYMYSLRTDDKTQGTFRKIPYRNYLVSTKNAAAAPGIIYAIQKGESKGSLWSIGATTAAASSLGEIIVPDIRGLAIRPSTNVLYGVSSTPYFSTLYRISCDSGATVPVRSLPIGDINAVAFSHADTLYCGTSTGKLYRLNFSSGEAVLVGTATDLSYWSLSFSPSGKLWASARHNNDSLYIVNTATGAANSVGVIGLFAIPRSIAFDLTGMLYCLIDNGSGEDYLATVDTLTGSATPVSETPLTAGNLSAIAMISSPTSSVESNASVNLPQKYELRQNYPNPFNPMTVISYRLPVSSKVTLKIYDVLGREVATLVNEEQSAGWKEVHWNAGGASSGISAKGASQPSVGLGYASGVYFYRLVAENFVETKKMIVVK